MSDRPKRVTIDEEGPREGFQSEKKVIPVADKVRQTEGQHMNVETLQRGILPDSTLVDVPSVPWQPTGFAGIDWKILMETESGMRTVLMRWAPGARLPRHEHVALEQTFVLEGSFSDHSGTCRAGQYVWRRAGSQHDAWTDEGCLMIAFFLEPNTFFA